MTSRGRAAAQPPATWTPPPGRRGLIVEFRSDDGRQCRTFDFSALPGLPQIREELADAFGEATGPLGTWRRVGSANGLFTIVRKCARWFADNRPTMSRLAELSVADARMLLNALRSPTTGVVMMGHVRALFLHCATVSDDVQREMARFRSPSVPLARQPYTEEEWRWIGIALRSTVRRARTRILRHRQLVEDYRAGKLDQRGPRDQQRCLGEVLDFYLRTGDIPRSPGGTLGGPTIRAGRGVDRAVKSLLHLSAGEAWLFGALLVALTGLNPSTVFALPAPHAMASAPTEKAIALVDAVKHRRGRWAAMTIPLTDVPTELQPSESDRRSPRVRETSLTTPFGVFMELLDLTELARQLSDSRNAFAFYNGQLLTTNSLTDTPPNSSPAQRRAWLREILTGEHERDAVVTGISLDRLRKTHLHRHRRPVAHTQTTLARYLRKMDAVTEEGFQIVREALDEQVTDALARRRMTVVATATDETADHDTVIGNCTDFDHSPFDDDSTCRQTFLTCLDCANSRAFPRHLPYQLAVLDALRARQAQMPVQQWGTEYAGRVAQLDQIIAEFEPAQLAQARNEISDQHRHLASRLLRGDLDPV